MKLFVKRILLFLFSGVTLLCLFIIYPNNLFARKNTYKNCTVYGNTLLTGNYKFILDNACALASTSELFDSKFQYDIFQADNSFYKTVSFKVLGPALARSIDNNVILNIHADFDQDLLSGTANKRNLTATIAHEMIHCLQVHKFGLLAFNPFHHPPLWKMEGYPEYVSRYNERKAPGYSLEASVKLAQSFVEQKKEWVELQPGYADPLVYFKGWIMIEYLIEVKGLTYEEILKDNVKEEDIWCEMTAKYCNPVSL